MSEAGYRMYEKDGLSAKRFAFSCDTAELKQWLNRRKASLQKVRENFKATAPKAERKVRIEVGYGLEGQLTDAQSSIIINNVIVPSFRQGDFAGGIRAAEQVSARGGRAPLRRTLSRQAGRRSG